MNHNLFKNISSITNTPCKSEFKVGDKVVVNFGPSGELGPGTVTQKIRWEDNNGSDFEGYMVELSCDDEGSLYHMGWLSAKLLRKAGS